MYLQKKSFKTGKRLTKRFVYFIVIASAILLAIIGLIILITSQKNLKDIIKKASFKADDTICTQSKGIYYTSGDNLIFTDYSSKQIWAKKMFSKDLTITSSESLIAAYNQKAIQLFDADGKQYFSKEITGDIKDAKCGMDKVAVITEIQTEDTGLKKYLNVFNLKGETIDTIDLEDQNVIDLGFYGTKSKLWVLTLDITGVIPISRIETYSPEEKQMTGIIDINGQLIQKLIIDETNIYVSGTTNLLVYSVYGEKKDSILIYGWNFHGQFYLDDNPLFIYVPRMQTNKQFDSLRLIKTDNSDLTIKLPPDIIKATVYSDKIYCFSKKELYKYSMEGKIEQQYVLPFAIDKVSKIYDKFAFLTKGSDDYILPLP
jgi:hypothetical protein